MKRWMTLLALVALVGAACSSGNDASASGSTASSSSGPSASKVTLTVSAASSLTGAFTQIGTDFEAQNPGVTVTFNFGPSDGLAAQIEQGAPVDVFASASPTWMDGVEKDPGISGRQDFAKNELAIIVPSDNPANISKLEDLATPGVKLVLAAEGVPAGDYARQILQAAGIAKAALANVVSNEEDDSSVIAKVLSGDADAAIAYVTDVTPDVATELTLVPIPDDQNVIATYPIAVVANSTHPAQAHAFVDYVLGAGEDVLQRDGFLAV
jgi:molybdate transport system substrate-binding protein